MTRKATGSTVFSSGKAMRPGAWRMAWEILSAEERRAAGWVLVLVILGAFSAMVMVGSVFPFLMVLADPSQIHRGRILPHVFTMSGIQTDHGFMVALGIGTLVVILAANGMQFLRVWATSRFFLHCSHGLARRLLARFLSNSYQQHTSMHSGELSGRVLAETTEVVNGFMLPAANLVASSMTTLTIVGFLLWFDPIITAAGAGMVGILYGATYIVSHAWLRRIGHERTIASGARHRVTVEVFGGFREIKLGGLEPVFLRRFDDPSWQVSLFDNHLRLLTEAPRFVMQAIFFCGVVLLCLLLIDADSYITGDALAKLVPLMGVFAFAGQRLIPEIHTLFGSAGRLRYTVAALERLHEDLAGAEAGNWLAIGRKTGRETGLETVGALPPHGRVALCNATYRFPGSDRGGIVDISLEIARGERIGIVGETGAGKTTLANVLLGLLLPTEGCLEVDGVAIGPEGVAAWQQQVGFVPQDIFLLSSSVAENIAFGEDPATIDMARVEAAARSAQIHDLVAAMPDGYLTQVGERGVQLSGGQRQRIGIARALYRNVDFIVLDEATSALDNMTEREVMAAINAIPGDRTLVLIAHRLSTLRKCDKILLLSEGRVAAFGSWADLERESGEFRRFVEAA